MYQLIIVTCPDKKEAKKIANHLLKERLAACVNIVSGVESLFWWNNKIDKAKEVMMLIKTKRTKFCRLVKEIKKLHSYNVAEIIAFRILEGEKRYLDWIDESVGA